MRIWPHVSIFMRVFLIELPPQRTNPCGHTPIAPWEQRDRYHAFNFVCYLHLYTAIMSYLCIHFYCYIQFLVHAPELILTPLRGGDGPSYKHSICCRDLPLSKSRQHNSANGISPTRKKVRTQLRSGISPAWGNNLQELQIGFHPLKNCDILLPYHSRTLPEQVSRITSQ